MNSSRIISNKSYIIYCRKSSESEERQVLSIDSQIKELKETARKNEIEIKEVYTESRSAKQPGRPIFNELMKAVADKKVQGILCWKLDRLARNPIDGASLIWALDQGHLSEIITPHGKFQNYSNDKFLMQIEFGMAKKYVDDLSDNVKRGNKAKLEMGWLPGLPPLGYLNEPKERIIVNDPDRFKLIRKIWKMLLSGYSVSHILDIANNEWGLKTRIMGRLGGKPLNISTLYKIFKNPFYYGLLERGGQVFPGKHNPMITETEFWKAQEILGERGRPRPKTNLHEFAYTGLIKCGNCGCSITAENKVNRHGSHYTYYHCTKKKKDFKCTEPYLNVVDLENQILENYLKKIWVNDILLEIILNYLSRIDGSEMTTQVVLNESNERAMGICTQKLKNLNRMKIEELISDSEYLVEKKKLIKEQTDLKKYEANKLATYKRVKDGFRFANNAKLEFLKASCIHKKQFIRQLGSNLFIRDKTLIIEMDSMYSAIGSQADRFNKIDWFEPQNKGLKSVQNLENHPQFSSLCTWVRDVRNAVYRKNENVC